MVHEWALAEAIANYLFSLAGEKGARHIRKVIIKLGVLQSIDREILEFSLSELLKSKELRVDELVFVDEPVVLRCRRCGYEWSLRMNELEESIREAIHFVPETVYSFFKCPRCGSRDFEIVKGRGVEIEEIVWGEGNE